MTTDSINIDEEQIKKFIKGEEQKPPQESEPENKDAKKTKKQDKKKDQETLKSVLTKMVPYINIPYAEHFLKIQGADPNAKAVDRDIPVLIAAAHSCQKLANDLEQQEDIKGYLIYQDKP